MEYMRTTGAKAELGGRGGEPALQEGKSEKR